MRELISDAISLYRDRPEIAEVIYYVASLPDTERMALVLAYNLLNEKKECTHEETNTISADDERTN